MANNQLLASDSFSSGSLAAGWAAYAIGGFAACQVVSGPPKATEPNALSTEAGQIWTGIQWPNDQISEVTATISNEATTYVVLMARRQTGSNSGYVVNIGNSNAILFRVDSGSATQLATASITPAANDVWTLSASGSVLTLYQNYKLVLYAADDTYPSGYPGFAQYSTVNITHTKVFSWRGYSAVQQDGIWQKQGIVLPLKASDIASSGYGISGLAIIQEGNAQLLSGTVLKMWFDGGGSNVGNPISTFYAESTDGKSWTRRGSAVLASVAGQAVWKNGSTYYMLAQPGTQLGAGTVSLYTSSDGISWSGPNSVTGLQLGTGGQWDAGSIYVATPPVNIAGTWYILYTGGASPNTNTTFGVGLATSPDLVTWTKSGSNPVITNAVPAGPVANVNGTYYIWCPSGPSSPEKAAGVGQLWNPNETVRYQSTDLVHWTNATRSIHHSQLVEGISALGMAAQYQVIDVGGKAFMYYVSAPADSIAPQYYQIGLAIAPARTALIARKTEDAVSQLATDSFTEGVGSLPTQNAKWVTPSGRSNMQIVAGNLAEGTVISSSWSEAIYAGAGAPSFSNDQYSEITLKALAAGSYIKPIVRGSGSGPNWYEALILGVTGTLNTSGAAIYKNVSGVQTQIGPFATITPTVNDVFRLQVIGNVLQLFQNGNLILQVQDVNNTFTSGSPGMGAVPNSALTDSQVSLWAGGNAGVIPVYPSGGHLLLGVG